MNNPLFVTKEFCNISMRGRYGDAVHEMDHMIGTVILLF